MMDWSFWDQYLKPGPSEARDTVMGEMLGAHGDYLQKSKDYLGPALKSSMGRNDYTTDKSNAQIGAAAPQPNAQPGNILTNPLGFLQKAAVGPSAPGETPLQQLMGGATQWGLRGVGNLISQPPVAPEIAQEALTGAPEALTEGAAAFDPLSLAGTAMKPLARLVGGRTGGKVAEGAEAAGAAGMAAAQGFANPLSDALALWKLGTFISRLFG